MNHGTCPICGSGQLIDRDGDLETKYLDRDGSARHLILADVHRLQCDSCGEEILDDFATQQIEDARRAAAGLLTPAEIRELRRTFGKTQVQMSRLLGIGEKTYCRWESGSHLQSIAFDNYLRLVRELPEAAAMLFRLEEHGVRDIAAAPYEEATEFEFLANIDNIAASATKFVQLMVTGMLHVPVERGS